MNEKTQVTHTSYRKGEQSRCLDYVFINAPETCKVFRNDSGKVIKPYRVRKEATYKTGGNLYTVDKDVINKDGEVNLDLVEIQENKRIYTDHNSLFTSIRLQRCNNAKISKPPPRIIKNEESLLRYAFKTDELAEEIMEKRHR